MATAPASKPTKPFVETPLYHFLVEILPTYSSGGRLVVTDLARAMGYSTQAIYLWFNRGVLAPKTARKLCELANESLNAAAIGQLGRKPPLLQDFGPFVLA